MALGRGHTPTGNMQKGGDILVFFIRNKPSICTKFVFNITASSAGRLIPHLKNHIYSSNIEMRNTGLEIIKGQSLMF